MFAVGFSVEVTLSVSRFVSEPLAITAWVTAAVLVTPLTSGTLPAGSSARKVTVIRLVTPPLIGPMLSQVMSPVPVSTLDGASVEETNWSFVGS